MPHLHLPTEHSDSDLALATQVAEAVESDTLFVAWTAEAGAGAVPRVTAVVREPLPPAGEAVASFFAGCAALWRVVLGRERQPSGELPA